MERDTITYYAQGKVAKLCSDLRDRSFGVPYHWDKIVNESGIIKKISPQRVSQVFTDNGEIIDSEIVGCVTINKEETSHAQDFRLDVYPNQPRGKDLLEFADNYIPK